MISQVRSLIVFNRLLILFAVTLTVPYLLWVETGTGGIAYLPLVVLGVINSMGLLLNEFLYSMFKRLKPNEFNHIATLSVFLPIATLTLVALNYLFTGNFMVYLLGVTALLQAHFLGCAKLSRLLMGAMGLLLLAGLPLNYPQVQLFASPPWLLANVGLFLIAVQVMGAAIARFVQHHSLEVDKLQSIATTDLLTGLTNRREFNSRLNIEIARARRYKTPLALALFDIDNFKRLNDLYGHQVGDRVLKELGKLLRDNTRESDIAARYGGEEFALILPETGEIEAYDLLERLRTLVSQTVFCLPDNPMTITLSIGVSQLDVTQYTSFEFVELADMALYEAKKNGKNQVTKGSALLSKTLFEKQALTG